VSSPLTSLPHEVGCRPPVGNVRLAALEYVYSLYTVVPRFQSAIADATARRSVDYLPLQIRNLLTDCDGTLPLTQMPVFPIIPALEQPEYRLNYLTATPL